jgi:hypothetical protein
MKLSLTVVFLVIAVILTANYVVWNKWWYPKTYEYALKLADDSSLPEQKAAYLEEYIEKIKDISGPPRYIFTRPDLDLNKQRIILQGLVKRFKDIAKLDPKEMAYQQGMFQLTGQEIDHQLKRISGIFKSAKLRESPFRFLSLCVFSWFFWIVGVIFLLIWFDDY